MDCAVELVRPARVGKGSLDGEANFCCRLCLSDSARQAPGDFLATLGKVLGDVVENLRAMVRRCLGPSFRLTGRFDRVADVLAIAQRRFAEQSAIPASYLRAIAGIRASLLAADVKLHRAVNGRSGLCLAIGAWSWFGRRCSKCRGLLEPRRFKIFAESFLSSLASIAAFPIPAEAARRVKQVGAIHPDNACLQLRRDLQCKVNALAPDTGCEAIRGVVG